MLLPENTGGRIGTLKRIEYLSKNNDVFLFCIIDCQKDEQYKTDLEKFCKEVHLYNRNKHKLNTLLNIFKYPYACASRTLQVLKKDVEYTYNSNHIDYVIVDFPQMIKNIPPDVFNDGKVVLGEHNIEYVTLDNLAESIVNPFKKFIYRMEARRMKVYEEKIYNENKIRLYTFVSSEDKLFFEKTFGKENTLLIPVGSEIMPYKGMVRRQNIMFFGKMEYPANAEAACEFAENVFVKVLEKLPKATLYIVGKNPLPKVIKLKERFKDRIIVTGTVDSVEPYYDIASLIVVPLKHGGGVKVKVLEALGHGKLIITTQKGIEGTDFINGYHLIVAKDNKDFAQQCVNVIKEPQKFEKIRKNGYDYVKANYTWKAIIGSFEITLKNLK